MIPVIIQPFNQNAASALPNIGTLANVSSNAPQVPPAIANLPPGTLIQGFVLNRAAGGEPILRSELGDFLLQSSVFLKIGSEVSIRVRASGAQFRADIIQVDGKPVSAEQSGNQKAEGNTQNQAQQANEASRVAGWLGRKDTIQRSQTLPNLDPNGNVKGEFKLNAVLLNPNANANALQLRQGASLILNLLNLRLPTLPTTTQTTQVPSGQAPTSQPAGQAAGTATSPTPTPAQPATTQPAAGGYNQYQSATPIAGATNAPPPTAASTGQPNIVSLTVIGHEQDGDAIVQTPYGLAKVTTKANLPTGSILQSQMALAPNAPKNPLVTTQTSGTNTPASLFKLAHQWPALQQIIQFLQAGQTDDGVNLLPISALPQLSVGANAGVILQPAQFSSGFFLFFAALQGGDFRNFLGEKNFQTLTQAGQTNLLSQAGAEFAQLARLAGDTGGHWQTMFFPVLVNGDVEMVRWFNKRDQQSKKDGKKETTSTRFIVEMSTSVLGELQLDGLYHYQTERNKLELVLRSHSPIDEEIRQGIMQIVQDVKDTTGVLASIAFQQTPHFPEYPLEDALKDIPDVMA